MPAGGLPGAAARCPWPLLSVGPFWKDLREIGNLAAQNFIGGSFLTDSVDRSRVQSHGGLMRRHQNGKFSEELTIRRER
eukprot:5093594-Prymnesium_polylepis.1